MVLEAIPPCQRSQELHSQVWSTFFRIAAANPLSHPQLKLIVQRQLDAFRSDLQWLSKLQSTETIIIEELNKTTSRVKD
jgi:hypothetical protein